MTADEFIGKAINEMIRKGISVQFNQRKNNSKHASNFFDSDSKKLVINLFGKPEKDYILDTFVHEYCHFRQWLYSRKKWKSYDRAYDIFERYIKNERKSCPESVIREIQTLELDCDKRVLELIKEYKLPIDKEKYIIQSNSYIISYNLIYKHRKFYNFSAYDHDDILKLVPNEQLKESELAIVPDGYEEIFLKESS